MAPRWFIKGKSKVRGLWKTSPQDSASDPTLRTPPSVPTLPASQSETEPALPTPSLAPSVDFETLALPNLQARLWNQAYDELKAIEPKVVEAYERILSARLCQSVPKLSSSGLIENEIGKTPETRCSQMRQLVQTGLDWTQKQASINQGLQAVEAVRGMISEGVHAAPEAAVAWVSVCLGLEILLNPLSTLGNNGKGIASILSRMEWYWNLACILDNNKADPSSAGLRVQLEKHIVQLYTKLFRYQIKSICLYHCYWAAVIGKDLLIIDDWAGHLHEIQEAKAAVQRDMEKYGTIEGKTHLQKLTDTATTLEMHLQDLLLNLTAPIYPPIFGQLRKINDGETTFPAPPHVDPVSASFLLGIANVIIGLNHLSAIGTPPTFRYHPLARDCIRVLTLQAGSGEDPIICSMSMQPLAHLGQQFETLQTLGYESVSYVWGEKTPKFRITCNWRVPALLNGALVFLAPQTVTNNFEVTRSLQMLLFHLRRPDSSRTLWIDQICIDQNNEVEKGGQIRRMAEIFAGASRGLIWLGTGSEVGLNIDSTFAAMDLLSILHEMSLRERGQFLHFLMTGERPDGFTGSVGIHSSDGTLRLADETAWRNRFMELRPRLLKGTPNNLDDTVVGFEGIRSFTNFLEKTSWFRRAWTFQEAIMGREPIIICGRYSRSWDVLYRACQTILSGSTWTVHKSKWTRFDFRSVAESIVERGHYRREFARIQTVMNPILRHTPIWQNAVAELQRQDIVQRAKQWRLKRLLPKLRPTDAWEPKDKVLALVSIAHDDGRKILFPDKNSQVELLYVTVAKYWITTGDNTGYGSMLGSIHGAAEPLAYDEWPCPVNSDNPDLSLLSHVQVSRHDIPSWVPDWSCTLEAVPLITCEGFRASGDWNERASIEGSGVHLELRLKGMWLLTIQSVNHGLGDFEGHAAMLGPLCNPYPTTMLTYPEAYAQLATSLGPEKIGPPARSPDCCGFWQYVDQHGASRCGQTGVFEMNHGADAQHTANDLEEIMGSIPTPGVYKSDERSLFAERALFVSTTGFLGLAPKTAKPGDRIYLLPRACVPFALRKNHDGKFKLIGECYAFGLMHGEAISGNTEREEDIVLV